MYLTKALIDDLFFYKDGLLYWKVSNSNRIKDGSVAGTVNKYSKRRYIGINGKYYLASNLIYILHNGNYDGEIDHINRNQSDDNISNLRVVTKRENCINRECVINNKRSLPPCIYYDETNKKNPYYIRAKINGKKRVIGWAKTPDEAYCLYKEKMLINI